MDDKSTLGPFIKADFTAGRRPFATGHEDPRSSRLKGALRVEFEIEPSRFFASIYTLHILGKSDPHLVDSNSSITPLTHIFEQKKDPFGQRSATTCRLPDPISLIPFDNPDRAEIPLRIGAIVVYNQANPGGAEESLGPSRLDQAHGRCTPGIDTIGDTPTRKRSSQKTDQEENNPQDDDELQESKGPNVPKMRSLYPHLSQGAAVTPNSLHLATRYSLSLTRKRWCPH